MSQVSHVNDPRSIVSLDNSSQVSHVNDPRSIVSLDNSIRRLAAVFFLECRNCRILIENRDATRSPLAKNNRKKQNPIEKPAWSSAGAADISAPAVNSHNENPSLVALGKKQNPDRKPALTSAGASDISTPAVNLLNKNPSLVALGKNIDQLIND